MQRITVLAVFAAMLCIVSGRPGDIFPRVWASIDLHEIQMNNEGTEGDRKEARNEWAKKYGVEKQWNEFINKRASMVMQTRELLARLPDLYEKYLATWNDDQLWKNIEEKQKRLAAKYKKEFEVLKIAKEMVERAGHEYKTEPRRISTFSSVLMGGASVPMPGATYPLTADQIMSAVPVRHLQQLEMLELGLRSINREAPTRFTRRILSADEPLIFIGGIPRSGTTLMRAMLDSHPDIRCGAETSIVPAIVGMRDQWSTPNMAKEANMSGISQETLDDATSAFLLELIGKHGPMAKRLCNKDPYTAIALPTFIRLFPNSKHILMIRDARASIHSIIQRKVPVAGYNRTNIPQMLQMWNTQLTKMVNFCTNAKGLCLMVYYERLVQRTEEEARRILNFLDVPWSEDVLKHEEKIGSEVKLNPKEFSTSQVKEKVNKKALTSWFGCYSEDVLNNMDNLAPLLLRLGYNTSAHEPDYKEFAGDPEEFYSVVYKF
ncbi:unnamed protein product [Cylicocyclus nassatus]|uniref:Protein-tyrosine sulfotransferase n=1 Tax=Cylicocyclus nassatus TaxID=53992 RepID=A0AA36GUZ6_CYLNA|nr:unnamed protein product [Cylicocyclus nassatus]